MCVCHPVFRSNVNIWHSALERGDVIQSVTESTGRSTRKNFERSSTLGGPIRDVCRRPVVIKE